MFRTLKTANIYYKIFKCGAQFSKPVSLVASDNTCPKMRLSNHIQVDEFSVQFNRKEKGGPYKTNDSGSFFLPIALVAL